ncbi:MAG: TetR/AcrR family transcriptional regulator [Candidatus Sericytochromatia bacterium]
MTNRQEAGSEETLSSPVVPCKPPATLGRKRDHGLDTRILDATICILAEVGFDSMTMDMVAAQAKAGKATLYRRWPSKAELVRDALICMSRGSVDLTQLPDTGTLRGDLLALVKFHSAEYSERKLRVLAKLGSYFSAHPQIAEEAYAGIFEPWTEINRSLMQRAMARGELPADADIELACEVIVAVIAYRSRRCKPSGKAEYAALLDHILLPALLAPSRP